MINYIWFIMVFLGLVVGIFTGNGEAISQSILTSIDSTVTFIISLVGLMCFWCGVMKVAEKSGFTEKLAKLMKPILKLIFKEAAKDEKALGAIVMNITANMMGLGNAATPLGLKAMKSMQKENKNKNVLSNSMAMFIVLNTASIQIIPTTVIAIRSSLKSGNATGMIVPVWIATICAAIAAIGSAKILMKKF